MLRPSQEAFEKLARRGNLVPVVRELLADMDTPLSLFRRLDDGRTSFLFESVEGGEKWGRFSFIGTGARAIFRARGHDVEWDEGGECQRTRVEGDPLEFLRAKLAALKPVPAEGDTLPRFLGGAVGLVSYDWVRFVEDIPDGEPGRARHARPLVRAARDDRGVRQRAEVRVDRAPRRDQGRRRRIGGGSTSEADLPRISTRSCATPAGSAAERKRAVPPVRAPMDVASAA